MFDSLSFHSQHHIILTFHLHGTLALQEGSEQEVLHKHNCKLVIKQHYEVQVEYNRKIYTAFNEAFI